MLEGLWMLNLSSMLPKLILREYVLFTALMEKMQKDQELTLSLWWLSLLVDTALKISGVWTVKSYFSNGTFFALIIDA